MEDHHEEQIQNFGRRVVELLRSTLSNEADPLSQNHGVLVQGQQLAGSNTQPVTQVQQQSALGNMEQAGTRQRQVAQGQQRTSVCSPRTSRNTVDHNVTRSFPGMYKLGNRYTPYHKKKTASVKSNPIQFLLLDKCTERTPKSSHEMALLMAGLGRRTISMILMETYPKMTPLEGAWMLYKAAGGTGQRKLSLVEPEAEGYTGAYVAKAFGGKGCLYIMPIQDTLDISPLPYSAKEFDNMPKARCRLSMPVQLLALHAKECEPSSSSDNRFFELTQDPDVVIDLEDSPVTSIDVLASTSDLQKMDVKVACPLCAGLFSEDSVQVHASTCGESTGRDMHTLEINDNGQGKENLGVQVCNSLANVLQRLEGRVNTTCLFNICVTREDLFDRGMEQWRRQKQSSPKNPLRVSFFGEPGIDSGALRKEFLTEMMSGLEAHFFQGGHTGKNPTYSIEHYRQENFKTAGEIIAVSITQGGPPPNFFREWCFEYISTGEMDKDKIGKDDVTDPELRQLIEEVEVAEPEALINLMDQILACGYSSHVRHERKEELIKSIILHSSLRVVPMLQQLSSGMTLYGLKDMIMQQPHTLRLLFMPGLLEQPDSEFLVGSLFPNFSEQGSLKRRTENKIVNFFQHFIQSIEDHEAENFLETTNTIMYENEEGR